MFIEFFCFRIDFLHKSTLTFSILKSLIAIFVIRLEITEHAKVASNLVYNFPESYEKDKFSALLCVWLSVSLIYIL